MLIVGKSKSARRFPLLSWIIRVVEGTRHSHVYFRMRHTSGVEFVYEASGTKVQFKNIDTFLSTSAIVDELVIPISTQQRKLLVAYFLRNAGKQYDKKQLLGLALRRLFRLKHNPLPGNGHVCVETITRGLAEIGINLQLDPESAGLQELDSALVRYKNEVHD